MKAATRLLSGILSLLCAPALGGDLAGMTSDLRYRGIEVTLTYDGRNLLREPRSYAYCEALHLLYPNSSATTAIQAYVNVWSPNLNETSARFTMRVPRCRWKFLAVGTNEAGEPVVLQANIDSTEDRTGDRAVVLRPTRTTTLAGVEGLAHERLYFRPDGYPIYLGVGAPGTRNVRVHFRLGGEVELFSQGAFNAARFLLDYGRVEAGAASRALSFSDQRRVRLRFHHDVRLSVTPEERPVTVRWARSRLPGLEGTLELSGSASYQDVWVSPGPTQVGYERRVRREHRPGGELYRVGFSMQRYDLEEDAPVAFRLNHDMEAQLLAVNTSADDCPHGVTLNCMDIRLPPKRILGRLLVSDTNGHPLNRIATASGELLTGVEAFLDRDGNLSTTGDRPPLTTYEREESGLSVNEQRLLYFLDYAGDPGLDLSATRWLIRVPFYSLNGWYSPLIDYHTHHPVVRAKQDLTDPQRAVVRGSLFWTVIPRVLARAARRVLTDYDEVTGRMASRSDPGLESRNTRVFFHAFVDDPTSGGASFMRMSTHHFLKDDPAGRATVAHEAGHTLGFPHGGPLSLLGDLGRLPGERFLTGQEDRWKLIRRVNGSRTSRSRCFIGLYETALVLHKENTVRASLLHEDDIRAALGASNGALKLNGLDECRHPRYQAVTLALLRLATGRDFYDYAHAYYPSPHDVDRNGLRDALTDGVLILRYLAGARGSALVEGALGEGATRTAPSDVERFLGELPPGVLDADGNGVADPLTDGILIIRYLFGLEGPALTAGAVAPDARRTTESAVRGFLNDVGYGISVPPAEYQAALAEVAARLPESARADVP